MTQALLIETRMIEEDRAHVQAREVSFASNTLANEHLVSKRASCSLQSEYISEGSPLGGQDPPNCCKHSTTVRLLATGKLPAAW